MDEIKLVKLNFSIQEVDFIVQRLTTGDMSFSAAMNANAILQKIQAQANDPELQGKVPKED